MPCGATLAYRSRSVEFYAFISNINRRVDVSVVDSSTFRTHPLANFKVLDLFINRAVIPLASAMGI